MKGGLETEYDSNNRWELYEDATNEWRQRKFRNKGRAVEKVSRMNALRFVAIVLPMTFLIACGTNGTTLSAESGPRTPLHNSAKSDEVKVVASLLDGGADIEARNENGATPLHVAAEYNEPEVVALLLDRGANIEAHMSKGVTPLHLAAAHNRSEMVALLLDRGANIKARPESGRTPLHFAARYNKPEVIAFLLDRGANIESRNQKGTTPLHFAARYNTPEVVALLLDRGADIEAREDDGPLRASPKGLLMRTLLVSLTLALEAWESSLAPDKEGWEPDREAIADSLDGPDMIYRVGRHTPLHYAAGYNKPEVVALLLDKGADIHARSTLGITPLHFAARYNTPEVVALLLDRGAPPDALDNGDFTPLDYAENNEYLKGNNVLERLKVTQE